MPAFAKTALDAPLPTPDFTPRDIEAALLLGKATEMDTSVSPGSAADSIVSGGAGSATRTPSCSALSFARTKTECSLDAA